MESYRKLCLQRQSELRRIMMRSGQHDEAIQLFLSQHAMLHSARVTGTEPWSFEAEVLDDMSEEQIRRVLQTLVDVGQRAATRVSMSSPRARRRR